MKINAWTQAQTIEVFKLETGKISTTGFIAGINLYPVSRQLQDLVFVKRKRKHIVYSAEASREAILAFKEIRDFGSYEIMRFTKKLGAGQTEWAG